MTEPPAPNWYPDPRQRNEFRYWDGEVWTDHVSNGGTTGTDRFADPEPPGAPVADQNALDGIDRALTVGDEADPRKIQQQLHGQGYSGAGIRDAVGGGGGTIFDEPILVVNQKAKLIELNNQYSVFDQGGRQLASVNQIGQTQAKKMLRLLTNLDQFMTHRLEVTDASNQILMRITRPSKVIMSTVIVENATGHELGRVVQKNAIGKINFSLESSGHQLGAIKAENWRAWNFRIEDAAGEEVARVTKTFEGVAKTLFTTADNYVVQFQRRMPEPLNSLIVASALSIDTALKQDSRGLG